MRGHKTQRHVSYEDHEETSISNLHEMTFSRIQNQQINMKLFYC